MTDDATRTLDLSTKTFEEFVVFLFDRTVVGDDEQFDYFIRDPSGQPYDEFTPSAPQVLVGYMTKLFLEFGRIGSIYSLGQLNQGIWAMLGENLRLYELLWEASVPIEQRIECIRSMYSVYADFVAPSKVEVMENCFDMWWDIVAGNFWYQHNLFVQKVRPGEVAKLDPESRRLLDAMFETLTKILALPDLRTKGFALHGLGHLHHPAVRETVQSFIDTHREELTEQGLRWVEQCRDGTVM